MFAHSLPESLIKGLSIRARELGAVNLGQGIPSFPTAPHIIDAVRDALSDPFIGVYPNFLGEAAVRQEIVVRLSREHPDTQFSVGNVLVTVGAMEGTAASILSVIGTGDGVAVVTPDYCNHQPQVLLAKGRYVEVPMRKSEKRWELDRDAMEQAVAGGIKMIVYTSPNNPTGAVFSRDDVSFLVSLAKQYDAWLLSDETYGFLTYDVSFTSLLSLARGYEKALVVRSFSKEYAMTGWRVGYVVAHQSVFPAIAKTHDALTGCAPKISQRAALAALTGPQDVVVSSGLEYARRRKHAISLLKDIPGVSLIHPEGAYYAFASYTKNIASTDLSQELLTDQGVAVIPGAAFGTGGERHFRISYAVEPDLLKRGIERIASYFRQV